MRLTGWLVAIGLALLFGWEHLRDDAALRALSLRADSLARSITDSQAVYQRQRAADSVALDSARARTVAVRTIYRTVQAQTDSAVVHIQDTNAVRELQRALGLERQAARAYIVQQDSTIALLTRQVAWRDQALTAKDTQLALQQQLLRDALHAKRPSRFWRGAAVGAAVVGGIVLLR